MLYKNNIIQPAHLGYVIVCHTICLIYLQLLAGLYMFDLLLVILLGALIPRKLEDPAVAVAKSHVSCQCLVVPESPCRSCVRQTS